MDDSRKASLTYFGSLLSQRMSRRGFVAASGVAAAVAGALPAVANASPSSRSTARSLKAIGPTRDDGVRLSPGLRYEVLIGWGDPLFDNDPGLTAKDIRSLEWLDDRAASKQAKRFGTNNDALAFFLINEKRNSGVLCVNHEYVMPELSLAGLSKNATDRAKNRDEWIRARPQAVAWMQAAHGVSVLNVERGLRGWQVVRGGAATRRITANTPMQIMGPARGDALMRTEADPSGTVALVPSPIALAEKRRGALT